MHLNLQKQNINLVRKICVLEQFWIKYGNKIKYTEQNVLSSRLLTSFPSSFKLAFSLRRSQYESLATALTSFSWIQEV